MNVNSAQHEFVGLVCLPIGKRCTITGVDTRDLNLENRTMVDDPANELEQGVLFALDRDRARELFSAREPAALSQFLSVLLADQQLRDAELILLLEGRWQELHDALAANTTDPGLAQAILGGRPMLEADELRAYLVRPDLVPHIAKSLANDLATHNGSENGDDTTALHALLDPVAAFYRRAAEASSAVLFAGRIPA